MPESSSTSLPRRAKLWVGLFMFLSLSIALSACGPGPATYLPLLTQLALTPVPPSITPIPSATLTPSPTFTVTPTFTPTPTPLPTATASFPDPVVGWQFVWGDEFNGHAGTSPDTSKWQFDQGGTGWGNHELEYYTNLPANVSQDGNGSLVITSFETNTVPGGSACWYGACRYTSARLLTGSLFSFTYGRVEARIQVPQGKGLWPAFWMLGADNQQVGWPSSGELDVMEIDGSVPALLNASIHGPAKTGPYSFTNSFQLPAGGSFSHDFHVFGLDWSPNLIRWYVDGNLYATVTQDQLSADSQWVFDKPFFILLNLAVGGDLPGPPDQSTTFPQKMLIDYIRVYQHR